MQRALVIALAAALFTTILGGLASADTAAVLPSGTDTVAASSGDGEVRSAFLRCRRLLGEDELSHIAYERCVRLWKHWCSAHPDARRCPRPDPSPRPCLVTDRVVDGCLPCRDGETRRPCPEPPEPPSPCQITDEATGDRCNPCRMSESLRPCPQPPPPQPCESLDAVSHARCVPCGVADSLVPCPVPPPVPIPRPVPCDRLSTLAACVPGPCLVTDRAADRSCVPTYCRRGGDVVACEPNYSGPPPADEPVGRILGSSGVIDWEGNDVHLRTADADS